MLFVVIPVVIHVGRVVTRIAFCRSGCGASEAAIAAVKVGLALVAQLAQGQLLLIFQVTANAAILAVRAAAVC